MTSPQLENGYTRIANELIEALARIRIPGEARQVFDVILRKTYGYRKKEEVISLSQFVLATNLLKNHVCDSVSKLKKMNLITEKGNEVARIYSINKDYTSWKPLPKKVTLPKKVMAVTEKGNESLPKKVHTIDNKTKETITKEMDKCDFMKKNNNLPVWLPLETWEAYLEMRRSIKKPLKTGYGINLALTKLKALMGANHSPVDVLNQSIINGWQGLFPVKNDNTAGGYKYQTKQDRNLAGIKEWLDEKMEEKQ